MTRNRKAGRLAENRKDDGKTRSTRKGSSSLQNTPADDAEEEEKKMKNQTTETGRKGRNRALNRKR